MVMSQTTATDLRKFCIQISADVSTKAIQHPTISDVINQARKLEEYLLSDAIETKQGKDTNDAT